MPNNILITGGAGFIGSRLSLALIERGHAIRVLDNLSPQIHGEDPMGSPLYRTISGCVDFRRGDVRNTDDLSAALEGIETVIHLAAETGTGQSMYAIRHYADVNVGGTALLLDLIANRKLPVRRMVLASSRAIYGEGQYVCPDHGTVFPAARRSEDMQRGEFDPKCPLCGSPTRMQPTTEDAPLIPTSVYGITKLSQEQMMLTVGKALGISTIALRYQNVYGPGQSLSNPYTGILSIFSTRIRHGNPINIFEDGRESRDFVYIDDVVAATVAAVEHDSVVVDAMNVGSGEATSVSAVVQALQAALGREVATEISGQFRVGDIRHNLADISRIRRSFGYTPRVTFAAGLERFAQWVGTQAVESDRYEESLQELRAKGLFK